MYTFDLEVVKENTYGQLKLEELHQNSKARMNGQLFGRS